MNTKRLVLISLLVLGSLILSACSGNNTVSNNWHGLAADAEHAYVASGTHIYAVNMDNGDEAWRFPQEADSKLMFYANPVLTADGQLLIGSAGSSHPFYSLNPANGKENWVEPFTGAKGAWLASPLIVNDTIYAPNTDGYVYVLDLEGKQAADPIQIGGALWAAPVTDGKFIYVASLDHHLHIIDPSDGSVVDTIDLGGAVPGTPAVAENGVYVGSFASTVEFIQSNGNHEVVAKTENWIWGSPVLAGETLYYADLTGKVFSFNTTEGSQNWEIALPDAVVAGLLVSGNQIYVATEAGNLIALDLDGNTVWEKPVGGKLYTAPVLSGETILVAPYQAETTLVAYDVDGKQVWPFTPEK